MTTNTSSMIVTIAILMIPAVASGGSSLCEKVAETRNPMKYKKKVV